MFKINLKKNENLIIGTQALKLRPGIKLKVIECPGMNAGDIIEKLNDDIHPFTTLKPGPNNTKYLEGHLWGACVETYLFQILE